METMCVGLCLSPYPVVVAIAVNKMPKSLISAIFPFHSRRSRVDVNNWEDNTYDERSKSGM